MSGGQIALKQLGIKVDNYYAFEIKPSAIYATQLNFPNTIQMGDVNNFDSNYFKNIKIDLLLCGSPCQDMSLINTGGKGGVNGSKSSLLYKCVEIMKTVNPTYFLFENVKSMTNKDKKVFNDLLGVPPIHINSALVSAQIRNRLYWTNIPVLLNHKKSYQVLRDILEDKVDEKYFYNHPLINVDLSKQVCAIMDFKNHDMHKRVFNPAAKIHTLTTCGGGNTQKKRYT